MDQKIAKYLRALLIIGGVCLAGGVACIVVTFIVPTVNVAVLWAGIIGVMIGILLFLPAIISI